jgi:hypothetical protein
MAKVSSKQSKFSKEQYLKDEGALFEYLLQAGVDSTSMTVNGKEIKGEEAMNVLRANSKYLKAIERFRHPIGCILPNVLQSNRARYFN